jgi:hypothetical protein
MRFNKSALHDGWHNVNSRVNTIGYSEALQPFQASAAALHRGAPVHRQTHVRINRARPGVRQAAHSISFALLATSFALFARKHIDRITTNFLRDASPN